MRDILGWSQSRPVGYEHSTTCHLLVSEERAWPDGAAEPLRGKKYSVAVTACGSPVATAGQVHEDPPDYAPYPCQRCLRSPEGKEKAA